MNKNYKTISDIMVQCKPDQLLKIDLENRAKYLPFCVLFALVKIWSTVIFVSIYVSVSGMALAREEERQAHEKVFPPCLTY